MCIALLALALCALSAQAEQPDAVRIRELEKKLEQSIKLIEQLQNRITNLEQKLQSSPEAQQATQAPAPPAPSEERLQAVEKAVSEIAEGTGKETVDLGVPVHGFADVGFGKATRGAGADRANGFTFGALSFYLTPQFTDKTKALLELAFEHDSAEGGIVVDLERAQLGHTFSDLATVWLGRFHTPYGYWNTAFHHGAQIQTALLRPKFLDFEDKGGIVPAHTVGLMLNGQVGAGGGKVIYNGFMGNGSKIDDEVLDLNFGRDDNNNRALGLNVGYRFGGSLRDLLVGVHALTEEVDVYSGGAQQNRNRLRFLGGYAAFEADQWEAFAEYYGFRNKDLSAGTGTHSSWAGFVQLGYRFGAWLPFVRFEQTSLDQNDNYFAAQASGRSYTRGALGLRFDLNPNAALKFEANRTRQKEVADGDYSEAHIQYSVRF